MKKITIGVFSNREDAENAISHIYDELSIDKKEISYVYKDSEGNVEKVEEGEREAHTGKRATGGAAVGATVGALAGIATVTGVIPVIGPLFAAGPLVAALGLTGAAATTAAGAVTGGVAGGVIGALTGLGVEKKAAEIYSNRVAEGDTLVSVYSEKDQEVAEAMREFGAEEVNTYNAR